MHSVSFYRRQQSQTPKTPVRLISRVPDQSQSLGSSSPVDEKQEAALVQDKVKRLLEEVCKQQTTIGQASQALNLCNSTVEFSGSREQVEGERLLLLASKFFLTIIILMIHTNIIFVTRILYYDWYFM